MTFKFMKASVLSYSLALAGISIIGILSSVNVDYTGGVQTFPVGISASSILIEAIESRGDQGYSGSNQGGLVGFTSGTQNVHAGKTLWLHLGGQGTQSNGNLNPGGGGFNGGGDGTSKHTTVATTCCVGGGASYVLQKINDIDFQDLVAGGGGGASDVRQLIDDKDFLDQIAGVGGGANDVSQLIDDIDLRGLVAGVDGGANDVRQLVDDIDFRDLVAYSGGSTNNSGANGGDGAGLVEGNGGLSSSLTGGTGGTQSAGGLNGTFGQGGNATTNLTPWISGGSSYISGVTSGSMIQGGNVDNGFINLTFEAQAVSVPEPSTIAIFALGLFGLVSRKFKKRY